MPRTIHCTWQMCKLLNWFATANTEEIYTKKPFIYLSANFPIWRLTIPQRSWNIIKNLKGKIYEWKIAVKKRFSLDFLFLSKVFEFKSSLKLQEISLLCLKTVGENSGKETRMSKGLIFKYVHFLMYIEEFPKYYRDLSISFI